MVLAGNLRLLRALFVLMIVLIFFVSCHSRKETTASSDIKKTSDTKKDPLPKKEANNALINKYAIQLGVSSKELKNVKLYTFVDDWYAVPYKYAGLDKSGIDCSGLACKLYEAVYGQKISRASRDIYASCKELDADDLKEGDFVFFKIESKNVSHVGVYLTNNKFVHASTKRGVIINDLNETYYKKYFYKGGRLKNSI
ncbi:MAG: hypothetical protein K0S33_552 [Bacteroidetes bacterium]|jgi:lipoprotein Spr|nr:hypothetical protein [Bacteroidota bacterium]